jgi:hypothetical protein
VISIASQAGWSLVGVLGSAAVNATGALALVAARGLDAALEPFAATRSTEAAAVSRLVWQGATRTPAERAAAQARAQVAVRLPAAPAAPAPQRGRPAAAPGTRIRRTRQPARCVPRRPRPGQRGGRR